MVLISPAVAPVLDAFLLRVTTWLGVFRTLTGIGVVALLGSMTVITATTSLVFWPLVINMNIPNRLHTHVWLGLGEELLAPIWMCWKV